MPHGMVCKKHSSQFLMCILSLPIFASPSLPPLSLHVPRSHYTIREDSFIMPPELAKGARTNIHTDVISFQDLLHYKTIAQVCIYTLPDSLTLYSLYKLKDRAHTVTFTRVSLSPSLPLSPSLLLSLSLSLCPIDSLLTYLPN